MTRVIIVLDGATEAQLEELDAQEDRIEHLLRVLVIEGRDRNRHMTQEFEQVQQAVTNLQAETAAIAADTANVKTSIDGLRTQVADLQAQVAAGNAVTPEQLAQLASDLKTATDSLTTSDVALDAVAPDPPAAPAV